MRSVLFACLWLAGCASTVDYREVHGEIEAAFDKGDADRATSIVEKYESVDPGDWRSFGKKTPHTQPHLRLQAGVDRVKACTRTTKDCREGEGDRTLATECLSTLRSNCTIQTGEEYFKALTKVAGEAMLVHGELLKRLSGDSLGPDEHPVFSSKHTGPNATELASKQNSCLRGMRWFYRKLDHKSKAHKDYGDLMRKSVLSQPYETKGRCDDARLTDTEAHPSVGDRCTRFYDGAAQRAILTAVDVLYEARATTQKTTLYFSDRGKCLQAVKQDFEVKKPGKTTNIRVQRMGAEGVPRVIKECYDYALDVCARGGDAIAEIEFVL